MCLRDDIGRRAVSANLLQVLDHARGHCQACGQHPREATISNTNMIQRLQKHLRLYLFVIAVSRVLEYSHSFDREKRKKDRTNWRSRPLSIERGTCSILGSPARGHVTCVEHEGTYHHAVQLHHTARAAHAKFP